MIAQRPWWLVPSSSRDRRRRSFVAPVVLPPRKEDARCCVSRRDELGRLPIGWCSDECERRPS